MGWLDPPSNKEIENSIRALDSVLAISKIVYREQDSEGFRKGNVVINMQRLMDLVNSDGSIGGGNPRADKWGKPMKNQYGRPITEKDGPLYADTMQLDYIMYHVALALEYTTPYDTRYGKKTTIQIDGKTIGTYDPVRSEVTIGDATISTKHFGNDPANSKSKSAAFNAVAYAAMATALEGHLILGDKGKEYGQMAEEAIAKAKTNEKTFYDDLKHNSENSESGKIYSEAARDESIPDKDKIAPDGTPLFTSEQLDILGESLC